MLKFLHAFEQMDQIRAASMRGGTWWKMGLADWMQMTPSQHLFAATVAPDLFRFPLSLIRVECILSKTLGPEEDKVGDTSVRCVSSSFDELLMFSSSVVELFHSVAATAVRCCSDNQDSLLKLAQH